MTRRLLIAGLLGLLAGLTGCQRLNIDKTYDVEPMETRLLDFDPPRSQQKLKVEVSSTGAPVSVCLVNTADKEAARNDLERKKTPAGSLGGQTGSETISFEASVPAKTEVTLLITNTGMKKAHVQVKVNGR